MTRLLGNVDWRAILATVAEDCEQTFDLSLLIDEDIIKEVEAFSDQSLDRYGLRRPNVPKIAGMITFWFRKLKPISFSSDTEAKFLAINELVALLLGLSICFEYMDDQRSLGFCPSNLSPRIFHDWVNSLRVHSHSPHSTTLIFEILAGQ